MAWGGVCGALAGCSLAALPLWPESRAPAEAPGTTGSAARVCARSAAAAGAGGPGALPAEPRRDRAGLGAGRIMPRPRTEGNTENEIALAS